MGQKLLAVAIGIGIAVWAIVREGQKKADTSEAVLADAQVLVSDLEGYGNDKDYVESVVSRAHNKAFSFACKDGVPARRFRPSEPASFSEDRYLTSLFHEMSRCIREDISKLGRISEQNKYEDIRRRLGELKTKLKVKEFRQL